MPQNPKNQLLSVGEIGRLGSSSGSDRSSNKVVRDAVLQTAFLGRLTLQWILSFSGHLELKIPNFNLKLGILFRIDLCNYETSQ
jgi:hypothetical protein